MRRIVAGLLLVAIAAESGEAQASAPASAPRNLLVRVQSELGQVPLGYSVVSVPSLGIARFTSANGAIVIPVPRAEPLRMIVKRLGFTPKDTVIAISDAPSQVVTIQLARVSFRLEAVRVVAWPPCRRPGLRSATAELRGIVEQVRQNAERYRLLTTEYPFHYLMEREIGYRGSNGAYVVESRDSLVVSGNPRWTYRPGDLVVPEPKSPDWVMRIPSISDLAEDAFIANHCFHVAGLESKEDARLLRIDIVAAQRLRTADVNVSVWLDPTDYQLRHATYTLTHTPREVYTLLHSTSSASYHELIPFVPVLHLLTAESTYQLGNRVGNSRVTFERQTNRRVTYTGARPDALVRDSLVRDSLPRTQPDR